MSSVSFIFYSIYKVNKPPFQKFYRYVILMISMPPSPLS